MGVSDIQSVALQYAAEAEANMITMANNATQQIWQPLEWTATWNAPEYVTGYTGGRFGYDNSFRLPSIAAQKPNPPSLGAVTVPTFGNAPEFLMAEPVLHLPTAPVNTLPSAPGNSPDFNAPALPDAPIYTMSDAPTFQNIVVPDMPSIEYPVFDTDMPVDDILAPTATFAYIEPVYDSALLDELKRKLMYDLVNGGYGIEDADEMRLWERAREREQLNAETTIQDAMRQAAARGFTIPPGALNAIISYAETTALEKNSSLSRDIMSKKADLYVQNRQFTIQQVRETEQMLITAFGYMCERLLNSAKAMVELSIAVFNARVAKYHVMLDTYKAAAQVHAELIRAASLRLEAYKTQVEGVKVGADVQRIHAEVYKVQVDGVQALINVYATQVQASKTIAEIERLKLEGFKAKVDTYLAQVQAKTAEFGMFESQIKGEMAKVNVYAASAQAYGTKVAAYKAKADAAEVVVRAQVQANQLKLDAYKSDTTRYSAELQASQIEMQGAVQAYDANIKAFSVAVDASVRASQQNVEAGKANAEIAVQHANVIASHTLHGASIQASRASASAQTMGAIAQAFGSEAASALSAASGLEAHIT